MLEPSWTGAEVRFIDYDQTIHNIRKAVAEAKAAHPEIVRVFLFGSLAAMFLACCTKIEYWLNEVSYTLRWQDGTIRRSGKRGAGD
jgi:hypothetical protein